MYINFCSYITNNLVGISYMFYFESSNLLHILYKHMAQCYNQYNLYFNKEYISNHHKSNLDCMKDRLKECSQNMFYIFPHKEDINWLQLKEHNLQNIADNFHFKCIQYIQVDIELLFNWGWRKYDWNQLKCILMKFVKRKIYFCISYSLMQMYIFSSSQDKAYKCCFISRIHFNILHIHQHHTIYNFENNLNMTHWNNKYQEDKNM